MTTKNVPPTLDEISKAVLAIWLRTKSAASADDLATHLHVSVASVRKVIKASTRYDDLDCSQVPGCHTIAGGSSGASGRYPATWRPDMSTLCALIRGEGTGMHRWLITGRIVPMKHASWPHKVQQENIARTEDEAIAYVRNASVSVYGELHGNTRLEAEWLGRVEQEG